DICSALVSREIWEEALASLSKADRQVLDMVTHGRARTLEDVGVAAGQTPEYARRQGGRRVLLATNDNLAKALREAA
ncbi:hypothetical protein AB4144_46595, partial [Rhizobiaceae sp. 2RAB30]